MHSKLLGSLVPRCIGPHHSSGSTFLLKFYGTICQGSVRTTLRRVHACLTAVPCSLRGRDRGRCRAVFCLVFDFLGVCVQARIGDTVNETSTIVRVPSAVCIFRLGMSGDTSRTLTRVSRGNCVLPCRSRNGQLMGINVDFSDARQAVDR